MRPCRSKGFIMILAILILSLAGMTVILVNLGTISIFYESKRAYYEACSRNLTASGYAWAQQAAGVQGEDLPEDVISIDVDSMKIPQGGLSVGVVDPNKPGLTIEITTICGQGTMMLRRSDTYQIKD